MEETIDEIYGDGVFATVVGEEIAQVLKTILEKNKEVCPKPMVVMDNGQEKGKVIDNNNQQRSFREVLSSESENSDKALKLNPYQFRDMKEATLW